MNPNPKNSTTSVSEILHRLIVPIQTRGNIGKSTEAIARCEWMNQRDVDWKGYDLDAFNRTLSTAYPETVAFIQPSEEPEGEIIRILRKIKEAAVTVVDPSAHMNQTILRALNMVKFHGLAAAAQARITVLIYPIDEVSDMDDISETVETLKDTVDWVVVRNRAKSPTTRFFDGSELESRLTDYGAAYLKIPTLLAETRNHLRAHEVRLGRGISPAEALKSSSVNVDLIHQLVLENWLMELFRNYDAIASHLLPTAQAVNIVPASKTLKTVNRRRGGSINIENIL